MTFKEYLAELFDKPVPVTLKPTGTKRFLGMFETDNAKYAIQIIKIEDNEYTITFSSLDTGDYATGFIKDRNVVMATVIKAVENFYKQNGKAGDIYKFVCWGGDKSRIKLYDALAKKFATKHNLRVTKQDSYMVSWRLS
jgi:hypothetical protein